jgi:hypothetical protein
MRYSAREDHQYWYLSKDTNQLLMVLEEVKADLFGSQGVRLDMQHHSVVHSVRAVDS